MANTLTARQIMSMSVLFLSGTNTALAGSSIAGRDSWISALVASGIIIILSLIFLIPVKRYHQNDFFDINFEIFGKTFGKFINIIYLVCAVIIIIENTSSLTTFIKTISLKQTSVHLITFFILITCVIISLSDIFAKGRFCEIGFYIVVTMIILSVILSIPFMDLNSLEPVMHQGAQSVFLGGIDIFAISFAEIFFIIAVLSGKFNKKEKFHLIRGILYGTILLCSVFIRNIAVLGYPLTGETYFPSYVAVSIAQIGEFFQRQEVLVTIVFLLSDVIKISIILDFCSNGIIRISNFKMPSLAISLSICAIVFFCSVISLSGSIENFKALLNYKKFILIPCVYLPLAGVIICILKEKKLPHK